MPSPAMMRRSNSSRCLAGSDGDDNWTKACQLNRCQISGRPPYIRVTFINSHAVRVSTSKSLLRCRPNSLPHLNFDRSSSSLRPNSSFFSISACLAADAASCSACRLLGPSTSLPVAAWADSEPETACCKWMSRRDGRYPYHFRYRGCASFEVSTRGERDPGPLKVQSLYCPTV
jgi:hypothetical protein